MISGGKIQVSETTQLRREQQSKLYHKVDSMAMKNDPTVTLIQGAVFKGGFARTRLYFIGFFESFAAFTHFFDENPYLLNIPAIGFKMSSLNITAEDFMDTRTVRRVNVETALHEAMTLAGQAEDKERASPFLSKKRMNQLTRKEEKRSCTSGAIDPCDDSSSRSTIFGVGRQRRRRRLPWWWPWRQASKKHTSAELSGGAFGERHFRWR
jgi:hypothetical protein